MSLEQIKCELVDEANLRVDTEFWEIYATSFSGVETEPPEAIYRSLRLGSGLAFRARRADHTVAMATCQILTGFRCLFLVYIAVRSDMRGNRVGGNLFEFIVQAGVENIPGLLGVVWEVDPIEDSAVPDEIERRTRRIRFFEQHKGRGIDRRYVQPAVDGKTTVPMQLLFRSTQDGGTPNELDSRVDDLIQAIYLEKYAAINGIAREHLNDLMGGITPPRAAFPNKPR